VHLSDMTFIAKVHNGAILLPPGVSLPEGAEVKVATTEAQNTSAVGNPKSQRHSWMEKFVGVLEDLPPDFAAEHDHYIHGTPKRAAK
jgi:hypothetical protein